MASKSFHLLTSNTRIPTLASRCQISRARLVSSSQSRRQFVTKAEQQSTDEVQEIKQDPVEYTGPPLTPLKIPSGKFLPVTGILIGGLLRTYSGTTVEGYSVGFRKNPAEKGEYKAPLTFFGRELLETSEIIPTLKRPKEPIVIYEFEACPFCKKVREAATRLDLDVLFYPTPRNAPNHRPRVKELGGKEQFPYMIDSNTGTSMYESDAIIEYLYKEYGTGEVPLILRLGMLTTLTCGLASIVRAGRGSTYRKAKYPDQPLVFWGYELSPFSKFVREVLVELVRSHSLHFVE
eukprot:g7863.t2